MKCQKTIWIDGELFICYYQKNHKGPHRDSGINFTDQDIKVMQRWGSKMDNASELWRCPNGHPNDEHNLNCFTCGAKRPKSPPTLIDTNFNPQFHQ